jgi:hypothetical protein
VTRGEIALRKELAVTHLRIARAELALSRARRRPSSSLATADSAVDLASSILAQSAATGWGGKWVVYLRLALKVAHVVLGMRRAA